MESLQEIVRFNWQGQGFETWLFQRAGGSYTAKTKIGYRDWLVTGGETPYDLLRDHWQLLPVALQARGLFEPQTRSVL